MQREKEAQKLADRIISNIMEDNEIDEDIVINIIRRRFDMF